MMTRLTDLELQIEDIPDDQAADAWKRLNITCEAFIADGLHVTIARTTYAPHRGRHRMRANEFINLSIDQGDYENAAILAMKCAQELTLQENVELYAQFALTLSNLALAQEYRKARR